MANGQDEDNRRKDLVKNQTFSLPASYEGKISKLWKKTGFKSRTEVVRAAIDLLEEETYTPRPATREFEEIGLIGVVRNPLTHDFSKEIGNADELALSLTDFRAWLGQHRNANLIRQRLYSKQNITRIVVVQKETSENIEPATFEALRELFSEVHDLAEVSLRNFSIRIASHTAHTFFCLATGSDSWLFPLFPPGRSGRANIALHFKDLPRSSAPHHWLDTPHRKLFGEIRPSKSQDYLSDEDNLALSWVAGRIGNPLS